MIQTCLHILNEQGNITPLNHTFIALIPKVAKPRKVNEYKLISLCNVLYGIVAKVIANRHKQIFTISFPNLKVYSFPIDLLLTILLLGMNIK